MASVTLVLHFEKHSCIS